MHCWGELESLGGQSVGEVRLVVRTIFRICGNESQPGLQIVEELAMPLAYYSSQLLGGWVSLVSHFCSVIGCMERGYLWIIYCFSFYFVTTDTCGSRDTWNTGRPAAVPRHNHLTHGCRGYYYSCLHPLEFSSLLKHSINFQGCLQHWQQYLL